MVESDFSRLWSTLSTTITAVRSLHTQTIGEVQGHSGVTRTVYLGWVQALPFQGVDVCDADPCHVLHRQHPLRAEALQHLSS